MSEQGERCELKHVVIKKSTIPQAGMGAYAKHDMEKFTVLGKYAGKRITAEEFDEKYETMDDSAYVWSLEDSNDEIIGYIDGKDPKQSNWLRYVNCPSKKRQENVKAIQQDYDIVYYTLRKIRAGEELFVYYGDEYYEVLTGKPSIS